jgi:hypothetical protein
MFAERIIPGTELDTKPFSSAIASIETHNTRVLNGSDHIEDLIIPESSFVNPINRPPSFQFTPGAAVFFFCSSTRAGKAASRASRSNSQYLLE